MAQLLPAALGALHNITQIGAATKGAQATITGISPAAGTSAAELQEEADALALSRKAGSAPWQIPAPGQTQPAAAAEGDDGPDLAPSLKSAGTRETAGPAASRAAEAPEEAAAPKGDAPLAATSTDHYRAKILGMLKALAQLASGPDARNATALILLSGNGSAAVSLRAQEVEGLRTGAGNDAVTVQAGTIRSVSTGAGADAVALEGEVVDGVRTDPGGGARRYRGDWRNWDFAKADSPRQGSADSLAVRARHAANLYTGGGDDAIAVQAGTVNNIRAGRGDDGITVEAVLVTGIRGGAGDDAITVSAERSLETGAPGRRWMQEAGWRAARQAVDVDGGSGNDSITLHTRGSLTARGGTGDDEILLQGGNVALSYREGDGDDVVTLSGGANVVIRLDELDGYAITRGEDNLTLNFGDGQSITFENLSQGGAIAVAAGREDEVEMLHQPPRLDLTM
ncbi:hypothetical protein ACUXV3_08430 [Roseobacteraceae bacterium NS-SX3]